MENVPHNGEELLHTQHASKNMNGYFKLVTYANEQKLNLKNEPCHLWISLNHSPMESMSVAIRFMPKYINTFNYLLAVACKITNFVPAITINTVETQIITGSIDFEVLHYLWSTKLLMVTKIKPSKKKFQFILWAIKCKLKIIRPFNHTKLENR